ncbi:MAG TPA: hypothetical protein VKA41_10270 [Solirubrobacterales bacterium]|nr:hypothetical protein [Solirubrobacterales bacterium]
MPANDSFNCIEGVDVAKPAGLGMKGWLTDPAYRKVFPAAKAGDIAAAAQIAPSAAIQK